MEDHGVGHFAKLALNFAVSLVQGESNWILAPIPTPNAKAGWMVNAVLLRYRVTVNSEFGIGGKIDKISIRDGDIGLDELANLDLGVTNGWQTSKLKLEGEPRLFHYGLGVAIHVDFPDGPVGPGPTKFSFASIGLEFVKTV